VTGPAVAARALHVRALRTAYPGGPEVLAGVDLTVPAGGFVSVVGPSGCGKSTLLGVIAGLVPATAGAVALEPAAPPPRPAVALVTQGADLLPWRRLLANLTLGARLAGVDRSTADAGARELAVRFGLGDALHAWPHQLSGGMRQRAALLRAVLTPAPLLLLDEPFNALDPLTRRDVHRFVAELHAEEPRTTLLVTHDVDEAVRLADAVVVLTHRPGRVAGTVPVGDGLAGAARPADFDLSDEFAAAKRQVLRLLGDLGGDRVAVP